MMLPLLAEPVSTDDYLSWLTIRRQLWAREMNRMESHEHGQFQAEYRALAERIETVRQQAKTLQSLPEKEEALRQELVLTVHDIEAGLEFLLAETPELAERESPAPALGAHP